MNQKKLEGQWLLLNYLGLFSILIGFIVLLPIVSLLFLRAEIGNFHYFLIPGTITLFFGLSVTLIFKKYEKAKLRKNHDAILILYIWLFAIIASAMPFYLSGNYTFAQAIFETSSGYSTTGLTVTDVSRSPQVFLLYRSLLQFFGGAGLVLILTAAVSDKFGMRLYNAEGHSDKLLPNLIRSGRVFIGIYILLITLGVLAYSLFGMSFFDAFNHSICAVATGGFSTHPESIGYYQSVQIETITIFLMIAGGTNFVVHFLFLSKKIKSAIKHIEVKSFFLILIMGVLVSLIYLIPHYQQNVGQAFRHSLFHLVSALTGTGYQITDSFHVFPQPFVLIIILFMVFGGGMGSTTGGLKQYRVAVLFKSLYWHINDLLSHKKLIRKRYINRLGNKTVLDKEDILNSNMYVVLYASTLIIGTLVFASFNQNSLTDSLFEYASTLGTVGLSVGITGPNAHPIILWFSSLSMFLGRLEFFVIFVAISRLSDDIFRRHPTHKHVNP